MLHVACYMLHVACCMLHVACYMLHVACYMLHVACCMLHVVADFNKQRITTSWKVLMYLFSCCATFIPDWNVTICRRSVFDIPVALQFAGKMSMLQL